MRYGINTIDDFQVAGKTVLCRIDINQPIDTVNGTLKDINRITAVVPTIRELSDKGARVVLLAHQGSDIEYHNYYTTRPHAAILQELLERPVRFIDDVCGPAARQAIAELRDGELLLLDNVRFMAEEQTLFELHLRLDHRQQSQTMLVRQLAPLADLYVCDAFAAAHRDQPSLCGFEQILPSAMGRLFEAEYSVISGLMRQPEHPCVFILGGAKIDDAFQMMRTVLSSGVADKVLTGGLVAEVLAWGDGQDIGTKARELIEYKGFGKLVPVARELLGEFGDQIIMPVDYAYVSDNKRKETIGGPIPPAALITDIGSKTAAAYQEMILAAKTVFVNGPMGVFEEALTEKGTRMVWDALGKTSAYTVVGGGDSIAATHKYQQSGRIDYICTGGGALIRFLAGEELPVIRALRHGSGNMK